MCRRAVTVSRLQAAMTATLRGDEDWLLASVGNRHLYFIAHSRRLAAITFYHTFASLQCYVPIAIML